MSDDIYYPSGCQPIRLESNNTELTKRLKALGDSLGGISDIDSEEAKKFRKLFLHLANRELLENSNADVQLYLAKCLAMILKFYAPEIPTTEALNMAAVYRFLFRVIKRCAELRNDSPMFRRYAQLIEIMADIMAPMGLMKEEDEQEAVEIFTEALKSILAIPSGTSWRNVKKGAEMDGPHSNLDELSESNGNICDKVLHLLEILSSNLIDELGIAPNPILDVIFHYLTEPHRTQSPESYLIVSEMIKNRKSALDESIRNAIQRFSRNCEFPDDFEMTGASNRLKFYDAIRVLNHLASDLVAPSFPEIAIWLNSEDATDRVATVHLIGCLACEKLTQIGTTSNDEVWNAFLAKCRDIDEAVRVEFVKSAAQILKTTNIHLRGDLTNQLIRAATDRSEVVRTEVITSVIGVAKVRIEAIGDKLLKAICTRLHDTMKSVRICAIKQIMSLYFHVMTKSPIVCAKIDEASSVDATSAPPYTESDKECVAFIPNAVLNFYRSMEATDEEARYIIERYFQLYFVPYQVEARKRMELMMSLYRSLNDVAAVSFETIVCRSATIRRLLIQLFNDLSTPDAGHERICASIKKMAHALYDPVATERMLKTFTNLMSEDESFFTMLKILIADSYTTAEIEKGSSEIIRYAFGKYSAMNRQKEMLHFRRFLDRCSPLCFDSECAKTFVDLVEKTVIGIEQKKKASLENCEKDMKLFKIWADNFAHLFATEPILKTLGKSFLSSDDVRPVETSLRAMCVILTRNSLRNALRDKQPWIVDIIESFKEILEKADARFRKCCKLASRLLNLIGDRDETSRYYETIKERLVASIELDEPKCANSLQILANVYAFQPDAHHAACMSVFDRVVGADMMLSARVSDDVDDRRAPQFDPCVSLKKQPMTEMVERKITAIKYCTFTLLYACDLISKNKIEKNEMKPRLCTFIESAVHLIRTKGDVDGSGRQSELECARLRLVAGSSLLKLCNFPVFRHLLDAPSFNELAQLIRDPAFCVRFRFAVALQKAMKRRVPIEFSAIFGLVNFGITPDDREIQKSQEFDGFKKYCSDMARQIFAARSDAEADRLKISAVDRAIFCAETVAAYSVWLLANQPWLKSNDDVQTLAEIKESVWLILEALIHARIDMQKVYKSLEKVKLCGDSSKKHEMKEKKRIYAHNKKIWAIADIGMHLLIYRAKLQVIDEKIELHFNNMFFYGCTKSDMVDPSENYAPDEVLDMASKAAAASSKGGRKPNMGTSRLNSSKNTSKSRIGAAKNRQTKSKTKKSESFSILSDDDENAADDDDGPSTTQRSTKIRDSMDLPETEEDEPIEKFVMKRARRKNDDVVEQNTSKRKKPPTEAKLEKSKTSPVRRKSTRNLKTRAKYEEIDSDEDEEEDEAEAEAETHPTASEKSLDTIMISPIAGNNRKRKSATLTSSTPLRSAPKKTSVRNSKKSEYDLPEDEDEPKSPPPKRRGRKPKK
ncbi:unnamed protein product [Caenorhabditis bovis]|uniref:Uncharacterized protein n=1 Tax=Caenorhabditis bovis TaxID=2654633 RepID=A0A8S1EZ47_9PELO|nr:unnamed protein product [Caenorhabditis bovis]